MLKGRRGAPYRCDVLVSSVFMETDIGGALETGEKEASRDIPLPIQREVRKRCGFGCVICGLPLYEYEHMEEWAVVKRHVAEEITLLCDQHHREKTSGLLPKEIVRKADRSPFNLQEGASKPYDLHFSGAYCEAEIGSNTFRATDSGYGSVMVPLAIDGIPILGFVMTDGHLLLNMNLFDEFNDLVLRIVNNRLTYSVSPWDITLEGKRLTIREARGKFLVEIAFETPGKVIVQRGRFLLNGVEVKVFPDHVEVGRGIRVSGSIGENTAYGFAIGTDMPSGAAFAFPGIPRYSVPDVGV